MIKNNYSVVKISKLTWVCLFGLLVSFFSYLYFLNLAVMAVAERTDLSYQRSELKSEIAILETKYIETRYMLAGRIASKQSGSIDKIFVFRDNHSSLAMSK